MSFLAKATNELKSGIDSFSPEKIKTDALKTKETIEKEVESLTNKVGVFVSNIGDTIKTSANEASNKITEGVENVTSKIKSAASTVWNAELTQDVLSIGNSIWNDFSNNKSSESNTFLTGINHLETLVSAGTSNLGSDSSIATTIRKYISKYLGGSDSLIVNIIEKATNIINDSITMPYIDGVTETSFGAYMRDSWSGLNDKSFLNYFKTESGNKIVKILDSTPLDAGETTSAIYGSMILGAPYQFNSVDDPNNRTLIDTFIKDAVYLSLTPGLPKYNGGLYSQKTKNDIYHQTTNPEDMLNYVLRNGLDSYFSNKDKRYYTFEAKYEEYFSYLEAMLNPIWIKLGLANNGTNEFNIFTFFDIKQNDKISPENYQNLKQQYRSSIAFFTNPNSISEMVDNNQTSFGSSLAGDVNSQSDAMQEINYLTGMGTNSSKNAARKIGVGATLASGVGNYLTDTLFSGLEAKKSVLSTIAGGAPTIAKNAAKLTYTTDMSQVIQRFATANGMKVVYPELWSESSYSKSININLSFTSPYGDPLSIFKYVYVPFCAMLCFALPRQAAENGFVSPFFVRADIPGVITSDLALISGVSWTKGGSNNLWTKDGLPRAIDISFSIEDLYPYLAMTKHFSFLSANPSYTVFLDNMAGMCSINTPTEEDPLNEYFRELLNRSTGTSMSNGLWNKFSTVRQKENISVGNTPRDSMSSGNSSNLSWFRNK